MCQEEEDVGRGRRCKKATVLLKMCGVMKKESVWRKKEGV